jgi:DNA-directed RNA polymerase specialized sigma24 family protein
MRKAIYYDETYCINLIKSALSPNGNNDGINKCAIKKHVLERLEIIKDRYGVAHEDIYSAICFDFLRKSVITKINNDKGSPATFILHYVFNQLRNIERSCARGTFEKTHKNCDAMDNIAFRLESLNDDGDWIPELTDFNDPEKILIAKETFRQLQRTIGESELALLLKEMSVEEYAKFSGISIRAVYKRINRITKLLESYNNIE